MKKNIVLSLLTAYFLSSTFAQPTNEVQFLVKISNGTLEGTDESGIRSFKGIPFAQPPIGELRWKEPQPPMNWTGIRKANKFGPRAMQLPIFGDMVFRSDGISEDCLYLNVWTPARSANEKLSVLVYFYGGGLLAGDGSEPRYDGESMARKGIVAVTVNYRLTIFGFFSHPDLTKESTHHSSGNYGLLDQNAALRWVQENIAFFGGDPHKVTIAGESAGSYSVSAQMASSLSKNLIAGAIGESGSILSHGGVVSLSEAEKRGVQFASGLGVKSIAELRNLSASTILQASTKPGVPRFPIAIDGYFFSKSPNEIYDAGEQAKVPLLVGWNSEEANYHSVLGPDKPSKERFTAAIQKIYGDRAVEVLNYYNASTDAEVEQVATELAADRFIGFSTWKWSDMQSKTGGRPVFRYLYARPRPWMRSETATMVPGKAGGIVKDTGSIVNRMNLAQGAVHSAEIEYALGNLGGNRVFDWQPEDYIVSEIMQGYFINFIKTGNPNGMGLPTWAPVKRGVPASVMYIDVKTRAETEKHRDRYLFLDQFMGK